MLRWMENTAEPLLPEDLARVQDDLLLFRKNRHKISRQNRDLSACPSSTALANIVGQYRAETLFTAEELRQIEDREIRTGRASLIAEAEGWRLLRIETVEGAITLGQGTRWCTAFTNGRQNYFKNYSDNLLYARSAAGERSQLHFRTRQFKDIRDRDIYNMNAWLDRHPGMIDLLSPYMATPKGSCSIRDLKNNYLGFEAFYGWYRLYAGNEAAREKMLKEADEILSKTDYDSIHDNCGASLNIFRIARLEGKGPLQTIANRRAVRFIPNYLITIADPEFSPSLTKEFLEAAEGHEIWEPIVAKTLPEAFRRATRFEFGDESFDAKETWQYSIAQKIHEACCRNPAWHACLNSPK